VDDEQRGRLPADGTDPRADLQAPSRLICETIQSAEQSVRSGRRDGKRFLYSAGAQSSKLKSGIVARLHRTLFSAARVQHFATLLDEEDLSTEELRALRRLVDAKLKGRSR